MKRLNLRKLLLEENRLYNLMSAGCSEREAYRITFDPLYFEREVLNMPELGTKVQIICNRMARRYNINEAAIIRIANKIISGYIYSIQDVRNITELGIPFMELKSELSKLKQTEMETKNKNERTYWVIGWRELYEKYLTYLSKNGIGTKFLENAYRFNCVQNCNIIVGHNLNSQCFKITEPIYKEGDILAANSGNVFIFDKYDNIEDRVYDKAFLWCHGGLDIDDTPTGSFNYISGFATESQKQRLFDALEKEGKRWNVENKVVEDISKPGNISFSVKLSQESVDLLMGEIDKIRESVSECKKLNSYELLSRALDKYKKQGEAIKEMIDSENKAKELIKERMDELANSKLSFVDQLKKKLGDDYEVESYKYEPTVDFLRSTWNYTCYNPAANLIVTYKPRRK